MKMLKAMRNTTEAKQKIYSIINSNIFNCIFETILWKVKITFVIATIKFIIKVRPT